jgi:hypothetical protein
LLPAGGRSAWHKALSEAIERPEHARSLARAGRQAVLKRFAVAHNTDQILLLIEQARRAQKGVT